MHTLVRHLILVTASMFVVTASASAGEPLRLLASFPSAVGLDPAVVDEGQLLVSRYAPGGNSREIVAIGMDGAVAGPLATGQSETRLVARKGRHQILSERARFTWRLASIDRESGHALGRVNLRLAVTWARIDGDNLLAYQAGGDGLVLDLASMKVKTAVAIPGGRLAAAWGENIVVLGDGLSVYDRNWKLVATAKLPERTPDRRYTCEAHPLEVAGNKAVVGFDCGDLLVFDLPSLTIERRIPGYSTFISTAVVDDLIITVNADPSRQPHQTRVYELSTGKNLGALPLKATLLYSTGSTLFAIDRSSWLSTSVQVYAVDSQAIRSGEWTRRALAEACTERELVHAPDVYDFIDRCEAAGVQSLIGGNAEDRHALIAYGVGLTRTLDRYEDGLALLRETTQDGDRSPMVTLALYEAEYKVANAKLAGQPSIPSPTSLADVVGWGTPAPAARLTPIDFGAFSDQIHVAGERLIVGRWACARDEGDSGIGVVSYERSTLRRLASVRLFECDEGRQAAIASMVSDQEHVYVLLGSDDADETRPNFLVLDAASLEVRSKGFLGPDIGDLAMTGSTLVVCNCEARTNCKQVDWRAIRLTVEVPTHCANKANDAVELSSDPRSEYLFGDAQETLGFRVVERPSAEGLRLQIVPRGSNESGYRAAPERAIAWFATHESDVVLVLQNAGSSTRLSRLDLGTRTLTTLAGFKNVWNRGPIVAMDARHAYVGLGLDLMVFDLRSGRLTAYLREFIGGGVRDNGNGVDTLEIVRLLLDRGRLIALTSDGSRTSTIALDALVHQEAR